DSAKVVSIAAIFMTVVIADAPTVDVPTAIDRICGWIESEALHQLNHVSAVLNRRNEEAFDRTLRQLCGPRHVRRHHRGGIGDVIVRERASAGALLLLCGRMKQRECDYQNHEAD